MNRDSVMFAIEGIDNTHPRFVARENLITLFAAMAQADLANSHVHLLDTMAAEAGINILDPEYYISLSTKELMDLLEIHMRAVNALRALLSLRHPDELVEAHM